MERALQHYQQLHNSRQPHNRLRALEKKNTLVSTYRLLQSCSHLEELLQREKLLSVSKVRKGPVAFRSELGKYASFFLCPL